MTAESADREWVAGRWYSTNGLNSRFLVLPVKIGIEPQNQCIVEENGLPRSILRFHVSLVCYQPVAVALCES